MYLANSTLQMQASILIAPDQVVAYMQLIVCIVLCWWPLSCLIFVSLVFAHSGKIGISTCGEKNSFCSGSIYDYLKFVIHRNLCTSLIVM